MQERCNKRDVEIKRERGRGDDERECKRDVTRERWR